MAHLHKRLTTEQVKLILSWYELGTLSLAQTLERLGIKRRQFFSLLKTYRKNPDTFSIDYKRKEGNRKVSPFVLQRIKFELAEEKRIIDNPAIPLKTYNYSAVRDAVTKFTGEPVSVTTVINKAKQLGHYQERPEKKAHDREVITSEVGQLLQHDSSHHLWSPFAETKWSLITTIDDHSRKLLYGDFFEAETTWAHIQAAEAVILTYGVGLAYYTDNHSIFRFVERRDSVWHKQVKGEDDVTTQWKRVIEEAGMQVWYALSPQAKGKVERPYGWLQDRIVRRAAKAGIKTIEEARLILADEIDRYNNRQVHSTTREIPSIRFNKAIQEGRTVFKPLTLAEPKTSTKDLFCIRETRVVSGYRKISWQGYELPVTKQVPVGATVILNVIPDPEIPEVRLWYQEKLKTVYRFKK